MGFGLFWLFIVDPLAMTVLYWISIGQRTCEVWPGPEWDYWNATTVQP